MKASKKWKYWLFSSLGIVSIAVASVATPLIVLKQNDNNSIASSMTNSTIDASTSNKLASFSTNWEAKTKEQQIVDKQFDQFFNYDGSNESSNTKDVTFLITNENSIKNKELMTKIAKGLRKLSVRQRNQIKNGMLTMHNLTKNSPITEKNIDSIYGHFISQDKINQIKDQIVTIQNKAKDNLKNNQDNKNILLFDYNQNPTLGQEIDNWETGAFTIGGVAVLASVISVIMWFCDWFGITTNAAISASIIAAMCGIVSVGVGIETSVVKAEAQGHMNESLLFCAHCALFGAPIVAACYKIATLLAGLSSVADSCGWAVPAVFSVLAITSWIISTCLIAENN